MPMVTCISRAKPRAGNSLEAAERPLGFAILTGVGMEVALTLALPVALLSQYINVGIRTAINGFHHTALPLGQGADEADENCCH